VVGQNNNFFSSRATVYKKLLFWPTTNGSRT
jgi:hypothetical protein